MRVFMRASFNAVAVVTEWDKVRRVRGTRPPQQLIQSIKESPRVAHSHAHTYYENCHTNAIYITQPSPAHSIWSSIFSRIHKPLIWRKVSIINVRCVVAPAGSPYYDNVRPLCYSDADAVLLCFDISRPETVESSLKKVRDILWLLNFYESFFKLVFQLKYP